MMFTFGKYAGYKVTEVKSTTYLMYALLNFEQLPIDLKDCLRMEIAKRLSIKYGHSLEDTCPTAKLNKQAIISAFHSLFMNHSTQKAKPL